jgi:2-hydroxycyclohexanecarboxyl-CoA dehydrogenase
MRGLQDRRAIVTGGGGAIGRAICRRLGEEGCVVGVFDIDAEKAAETARLVGEVRGRAEAFAVDITDRDAVVAAVARCEAALGPTDILVNNAGWDRLGSFLDTEAELWQRIVAINLWGPLYMHHAVVQGMAARGTGKVINIASDAARVGSSGEAVYAACKGGIVSFSKTLARELARQRINVNVVCPGPTETPLLDAVAGEGEMGQKIVEGLKRAIPFRRLGQPDDLPGIVAFLASADADFITGQVISVSGGLTMAG